jgi:amino acid transporter
VTLPLVVLISFLAQPRLQYALAEDGLIPKIFSETDGHGNLRKGIIISGILCTLVACAFPPALPFDSLTPQCLSHSLTSTI